MDITTFCNNSGGEGSALSSLLKIHYFHILFRMKHEKKYSICGLAWHPKYKQIAYTDTEGNLGLLENVGDVEKPNDKVLRTKDLLN